MQDYSQLERFGVHYCHPTPACASCVHEVSFYPNGTTEGETHAASLVECNELVVLAIDQALAEAQQRYDECKAEVPEGLWPQIRDPAFFTETNEANNQEGTFDFGAARISLHEIEACASCVHEVSVDTTLTVIKAVVNNAGGTANAGDFTMNVTATNPSQASFAGSAAGTTITLEPGAYSVAETGPAGYAESSSADCSGTIALGESKTCTITNDDISPTLTVIKVVVNGDGGTAIAGGFTMNVTATNPSQASYAGSAVGTTITLEPGAYSVAETGPAGYAESPSADCSGTIALGESKTCTIINDDISPTEAISNLIANIESLALPSGQENALLAKLNVALDSLASGRDNAAVNQLGAFINQVEAQRGKKISDADVDALISAVVTIINSI